MDSLLTIVGLIDHFKSNRRPSSVDEYQHFLMWLNDKKHTAVVHELKTNEALALVITKILQQNHHLLLSQLSKLTQGLGQSLVEFDLFKELANVMNSNGKTEVTVYAKPTNAYSIQRLRLEILAFKQEYEHAVALYRNAIEKQSLHIWSLPFSVPNTRVRQLAKKYPEDWKQIVSVIRTCHDLENARLVSAKCQYNDIYQQMVIDPSDSHLLKISTALDRLLELES